MGGLLIRADCMDCIEWALYVLGSRNAIIYVPLCKYMYDGWSEIYNQRSRP